MYNHNSPSIGSDLFFCYIRYQSSEEIIEMLQLGEININVQDVNGRTGLHIATESSLPQMLKLLLNFGANPNIPTYKDIGSNTPLHIACEKQNRQVAELLIASGSDLNARNKLGQTCLHISVRKENIPMSKLLIQKGIDVHIRDVVGCNASFYVKMLDLKPLMAFLPTPVSMKPEEVMEHHIFVRSMLGIKSESSESHTDRKANNKKSK